MSSTSPPLPTCTIDPRASRLLAEHRELDARFEDLLSRAESGEWSLCDAVWDELSRKLDAHMRFEEEELLEPFAGSSAAAAYDAVHLRREHQAIREVLERLGIQVQLHALRETEVRALVELLRAHAERENRALYPWAAAVARSAPAAARPRGFARRGAR
jgi:hemerythrin-like domain-containing protein